MAIYPVKVFTNNNAIVGYDDRYKSSILGAKFAGMPKGVYVGFTPSVSPPSPVLTLGIDATHGYSLIKVPSSISPSGMDVITTSPITLDFTGQLAGDFPIHVICRVNYDSSGSIATNAEIITRSAAAVGFDEILICVVSGIPASLSIAFDASLGQRDAPLAFTGINFGFMPSGSVEDLESIVDAINEVVEARVGLDNSTYSNISARLAGDQSAGSMASRLGLALRVLRSNDYAMSAGQESINVSGSFTAVDRDFNPLITLDGSGAETSTGAVSSPNDTTRNVCILQNATTGYRPVNDPNARLTVFGRLSGPTEIPMAGTWTFTNAGTGVTAVNGQATTEIQVGDTIQGADGRYYEVATITNNNNIVLSNAYVGMSASTANIVARRWTLTLRVLDNGLESNSSLPTPMIVRFFFPAFLTMENSNYDWRLAAHNALEKEPMPQATTTTAGLNILATPGAFLGSVSIQNAGVALVGGPFHTINFSAPSASIIPGSTTGEIEVANIGPTGAPGSPGAAGGPGPTGPTGPGFNAFNEFEVSGEFTTSPGVLTTRTFTRDMGHNVRVVFGNIAKWRDLGFFSPTNDLFEVLDVRFSGTEATIEVQHGGVAGDNLITLFLSSAGDV